MTLGSRGDVQPYVALGQALSARGHDVTLSAPKGFDALITGHGLSAAPLSIDMQAVLDMPEVRAALRTIKGKWDAFRASQSLMQGQLDEMWAIARELSPNLIVYHPKGFVAAYLARALGAIAVPTFLQPAFAPTAAFANPLLRMPELGRWANRLSWAVIMPLMQLGQGSMLKRFLPRHADVPASPSLSIFDGFHPHGHTIPRLFAHSAHLVPKPPEWSAQDHVTGAWFVEADVTWQPPENLTAFLEAGPPPVYLGFGSMPAEDAKHTAATVVAAVQQSGSRAVLAKGWGALGAARASENIHVIETAPHGWLFPRCAAVVHHGGAGTTHQGLRCGRPTLVCPMFGDQPFWGRVVAEAGAGPRPLPFEKLNAAKLASALTELRDPALVRNAERLGQAIRSEDGVGTAADLIEATLEQ